MKGLRRQRALGPARLGCSGFTCQQNEPPTKEGGASYCGSCLESAEVRRSLEALRLGVRDQPRQTGWLAVAMYKKKKDSGGCLQKCPCWDFPWQSMTCFCFLF